MAQEPRATAELTFVKSDGTRLPSGSAMAGSSTYYAAVGGQSAPYEHLQLLWDGTITAVVTLWSCDFDDFPIVDNADGHWIQENPSTAYIAVSPSASSGTVSAATLTVLAVAGGASCHVGNFGARRLRIRVVTTVGGVMRGAAHGKA